MRYLLLNDDRAATTYHAASYSKARTWATYAEPEAATGTPLLSSWLDQYAPKGSHGHCVASVQHARGQHNLLVSDTGLVQNASSLPHSC